MRHIIKLALLPLLLLLLTSLACGGSFSTANISDAYMSLDSSGEQATSTFAPTDSTFYSQVQLSNAPDDTTLRAVWTAVSVAGEEPDLLIDETTLTAGDGLHNFSLSNEGLWPVGEYKVDLYLNDELDRTLFGCLNRALFGFGLG